MRPPASEVSLPCNLLVIEPNRPAHSASRLGSAFHRLEDKLFASRPKTRWNPPNSEHLDPASPSINQAATAAIQSAQSASFTSKETGLLTRDLSSWTPPP